MSESERLIEAQYQLLSVLGRDFSSREKAAEALKSCFEKYQDVIHVDSFLDTKETRGRTALMQAIHQSKDTLARCLVEDFNANVTLASPQTGNTALHWAVLAYSSPEIIRMLCEKGGPLLLELPNAKGNTALHLATMFTRNSSPIFPTVKLFCELGAPLEAKSMWGETVLHTIITKNPIGAEQTIDYLCQKQPSLASIVADKHRTPLHVACSGRKPDPEVVRVLCHWNCPVDAVDCGGDTALHLALMVPERRHDAAKITRYLYEQHQKQKQQQMTERSSHNRKSILQQRNSSGRSPLLLAFRFRCRSTISVILDLMRHNQEEITDLEKCAIVLTMEYDDDGIVAGLREEVVPKILDESPIGDEFRNEIVNNIREQKSAKMLRKLLQFGVPANSLSYHCPQNNPHRFTLLQLIAQDERSDFRNEACDLLLQNGVDPNVVCPQTGHTAFHFVCRDAARLVDTFLHYHADPSPQILEHGDTPIHCLAKGSLCLVDRALQRITSICSPHVLNMRNHKGETALLCAILYREKVWLPLIHALLQPIPPQPPSQDDEEEGMGMTRLHEAIDVNIPDHRGWTPLHAAIHRHCSPSQIHRVQGQLHTLGDFKRCTNRLLEHGAHARVATEDGITPLHLACQCSHPSLRDQRLAQDLVARGANVNAQTRCGVTPLLVACYSNWHPLVHFLVEEALCDVTLGAFENRCTPLLVASLNKNANIVYLLVRNGALFSTA